VAARAAVGTGGRRCCRAAGRTRTPGVLATDFRAASAPSGRLPEGCLWKRLDEIGYPTFLPASGQLATRTTHTQNTNSQQWKFVVTRKEKVEIFNQFLK